MISKVTKHFPLPRDYREEREEKVNERGQKANHRRR